MNEPHQNLTIRPPRIEDAQETLVLINAQGIADYGEPDYYLDDLLHDWSGINLDQDAWLVFTPDKNLIGYGAVIKSELGFWFDYYTHPSLSEDRIGSQLLRRCEARAYAQLKESQEDDAVAIVVISEVNSADRHILEKEGFTPRKHHFRMQIEFITKPVSPVWPAEWTLRTVNPAQDDRLIYDFMEAAYDQPGRVAPTFESWRDYMMRPDHFVSDLWFLLFAQEELIGAILCYDYPDHGWVRQLGVSPSRWRKGVGSKLLQHVFHLFFQRGHKKVGLGVDTRGPNAHALYESVGMKKVRHFDEYQKDLHVK